MSTAQIKALEDFVELLDRNATTHAIRTAVDLGLITELEKGQKTLEALAQELDLDADSLGLLMKVLCRTELIEKYGDDFALSTAARMIPHQFRDLGDHHWQYLGQFIRSGNALPMDAELPVTEADFEINWASTEWTQTPAAMEAAEILQIGSKLVGTSMLEIGGGSAVFSAAFAHRDPTSTLTLLDREPGLKRAETTVKGISIEERTTLKSVDYLVDGWTSELGDQKFDLLILAGLTHRLSDEQIGELLSELSKVMHEDSQLILIDIFPGQEAGDRHREIYSLELQLRTKQGRVRERHEVEALANKHNFQQRSYEDLVAAPFVWGMMVLEVG